MAITEIPDEVEKRQVDDLFLLVGGNPLPNAVAGRTLLKDGGRIVLVYSDQTDDVRRQLKKWFSETLKYRNREATIESKRVEPAEASSVYTALKNEVGEDASVGLHYTGGKKSMAVHAYRGVEDAAQGTPVMSYLDASSLAFHFDPPDPRRPGGGGKSVYVGDAVNLEVEDLLTLHGWTLSRGKPSQRPLMLKTARALLDVYTGANSAKVIQKWRDWKGKWRGEWIDGTNRQGEARDDLKEREVPLPGSPQLEAVAQALRDDLDGAVTTGGQFHEEGFRLDKAADVAGFETVGDFCRWLDGSWLESIVLEALQNMSRNKYKMSDMCMGFHLKPARGKEFEFEFDVVALRGYQLFAFSCTTVTEENRSGSDRGWGRLKGKLFELYMRARQFGGTEARMALVCMANDAIGLQRQAQRDIWADDVDEQRLRVFGKHHMDDLSGAIAKWIKSQSGSA